MLGNVETHGETCWEMVRHMVGHRHVYVYVRREGFSMVTRTRKTLLQKFLILFLSICRSNENGKTDSKTDGKADGETVGKIDAKTDAKTEGKTGDKTHGKA